jgi:HEPN domain-containing protein
MPAGEDLRPIVSEWVAKAEDDLTAALQILKLGKRAPTGTVSFHAQQCVEKYLKALLVVQGDEVPRTHDIEVLLELVVPSNRPVLTAREKERLTRYAAEIRYPGSPNPSLTEARDAVALARRVRAGVRKILPK